ncbi:hypothetical protein Fmac_021605 [Flemingia macrophylla]|uniref:Uncharacterized protein n=1 Tax=Flemingia macrophylla TaxID=520843 RepID=A0ABD1LXE0_9FABA
METSFMHQDNNPVLSLAVSLFFKAELGHCKKDGEMGPTVSGPNEFRDRPSPSTGTRSNMLRSYTDDTPSLKTSPIVVLIMSFCFIGFVIVFHVFGKLYRYQSATCV